MLRTLLISIALILPMTAALSQELFLPFPIPEGSKQLNGEEIHTLLSGKCIDEAQWYWAECFDAPAANGVSAPIYGKSARGFYRQPSDWRVVGDFLCYRLEAAGHVDKCHAIALDNSTGEIVAFDLEEARERKWEKGKWRARVKNARWRLFR
jgi:hypothetical protein